MEWSVSDWVEIGKSRVDMSSSNQLLEEIANTDRPYTLAVNLIILFTSGHSPTETPIPPIIDYGIRRLLTSKCRPMRVKSES